MLKGYVLSNVRQEDDQRALNKSWKEHMQNLKELGDEEDVDFFKNWLRARHAKTIRQGRKGAENPRLRAHRLRIPSLGARQAQRLGLTEPDAFVRFVSRDLDFYARRQVEIRRAARELTPGWEAVYYNEDRGFTLQTQALLASLTPDDDAGEIRRKVALVADFLDIWLARRVWNFRTVSYSSVRNTLFTLTRELRGKDAGSLSEFCLGSLTSSRSASTVNQASDFTVRTTVR